MILGRHSTTTVGSTEQGPRRRIPSAIEDNEFERFWAGNLNYQIFMVRVSVVACG